MAPRTPAEALAATASKLVGVYDITDVMSRLVVDCAFCVGADAVGLVVRDSRGVLDLLSASSHATEDLEVLQVEEDDGPCIDAIRLGTSLSCVGDTEICRRWPRAGAAIVGAGFSAVHSVPIRWHDEVFGGLNIFRRSASHLTVAELATAQTFADLATLVLAQSPGVTPRDVASRVDAALQGRIVVEQAKGVLAEAAALDMAAAYARLRELAESRGGTLSEAASDLIARAAAGGQV